MIAMMHPPTPLRKRRGEIPRSARNDNRHPIVIPSHTAVIPAEAGIHRGREGTSSCQSFPHHGNHGSTVFGFLPSQE